MKRIIFVEDDYEILEIARFVFERAGYEIELYSDGRQLLKDNYDLPDIFILDKQLSGGDGLAICRKLKTDQHTRKIPVIILSANPDVFTLAKDCHADKIMEKPFELQDLLQNVAFLTRDKSLHTG